MNARDAWEYASFVVTALALPFAIVFFAWEQRKERDNEEEEGYQLLSNAYNDFLKVVLANPDLHLRTNEPLLNPTAEQNERMLVIFDMLMSLFERAYLVAYKGKMSETEARRWNSWDDYMREWCRREDFHNALPLLLRDRSADSDYIQRIRPGASAIIRSADLFPQGGNKHESIAIVGAARTAAGGAFMESFRRCPRTTSATPSSRPPSTRHPGDAVGEVLFGNCLMAGQGQAPARQAAFKGGLPKSAGAVTLSKMCGSGMKAAMLAHDMLLVGTHEVMVTGGMESMTNAPYLMLKGRGGYRMGHDRIFDHMMLDGLEDAYEAGRSMGTFGEDCAAKYKFTRSAGRAATQRQAAKAATESGAATEITPVAVKDRAGERLFHRRGPGQGQARQDPDAQAGVQEGRHDHRRIQLQHQRRRCGNGVDEGVHCRALRQQADRPHRGPRHARARAGMVHHGPGGRGAEAAGQDRLEGRRCRPVGSERGLRSGADGADGRAQDLRVCNQHQRQRHRAEPQSAVRRRRHVRRDARLRPAAAPCPAWPRCIGSGGGCVRR
jgi:hypothetical protein